MQDIWEERVRQEGVMLDRLKGRIMQALELVPWQEPVRFAADRFDMSGVMSQPGSFQGPRPPTTEVVQVWVLKKTPII
jgi:hypothetical protein